MVDLLNAHLATVSDLYSQTKQAHELFDKLAGVVEPFADLIAERAAALGGTALGTTRLAAKNSSLAEYPLDARDGKAHLEALIERYAAYAKMARKGIEAGGEAGDLDTADLFTEISREIDKALWFLEAHLQ